MGRKADSVALDAGGGACDWGRPGKFWLCPGSPGSPKQTVRMEEGVLEIWGKKLKEWKFDRFSIGNELTNRHLQTTDEIKKVTFCHTLFRLKKIYRAYQSHSLLTILCFPSPKDNHCLETGMHDTQACCSDYKCLNWIGSCLILRKAEFNRFPLSSCFIALLFSIVAKYT